MTAAKQSNGTLTVWFPRTSGGLVWSPRPIAAISKVIAGRRTDWPLVLDGLRIIILVLSTLGSAAMGDDRNREPIPPSLMGSIQKTPTVRHMRAIREGDSMSRGICTGLLRVTVVALAAMGATALPGCSSPSTSPVAPTIPMVVVSAVSGTVREVNGGGVAGAIVTTRSNRSGAGPDATGPATVTNANGEFSLPAWEMPAQIARAYVNIEGPRSSQWFGGFNRPLMTAPAGEHPASVVVDVRLQSLPSLSPSGLDIVVSNENLDILATPFSCGPCGTVTFQPDVTSDVVLEAEWATSEPLVLAIEGISGGYSEQSVWLGPVEAMPGESRLWILVPRSFTAGLNLDTDLHLYIGPRGRLAEPVSIHLTLRPVGSQAPPG